MGINPYPFTKRQNSWPIQIESICKPQIIPFPNTLFCDRPKEAADDNWNRAI